MAYTTEADLQTLFGTGNILRWADLDGDGVADTNRVTNVIAIADAEIDDSLRESRYYIPLTQKDGAGTPEAIRWLSARLAGVYLYEFQGIMDVDPKSGNPSHQLSWHRQYAMELLEKIRAGTYQIDALLSTVE